MQSSLLFAFLALLNLSLAFPLSISSLFHRQANTTVSCAEYSAIANYTTISNNSTMRAAFIQNSPAGTDATTSILDTATPKLPKLQFDVALNAACGNLTTIAIAGAAENFSMGIVSGFKIKGFGSGAERATGGAWATVVLVAGLVGMALL